MYLYALRDLVYIKKGLTMTYMIQASTLDGTVVYTEYQHTEQDMIQAVRDGVRDGYIVSVGLIKK